MSRQRKTDEDLWEDGQEKLSSDHVVERFFSRHERDEAAPERRSHALQRQKRRPPRNVEPDE